MVTDLARARAFWVDVLGFVVTLDTGSALYLRGYDELTHHNLILTERAEPAAGHYTGDPDHPVLRWDVSDPRRRDFYGHAVVPSWYAGATTVLDLDGKPRPATEQHQILESAVGADGFRVR